MTTVHDVLLAVEQMAPSCRKESWDNVGLLCGCADQPVKKILVALDPFLNVCEEAAEIGADLIVTHHPLIFQPAASVTEADSVGRCIRLLVKHDISAINAHTNLDVTPGGVNDKLAKVLGLSDVNVLDPQGTDEKGRPWGLIRMGMVEETALSAFAASVKTKLNCPGLRYVDGGKTVCKVAVGGGACSGFMKDVLRAGCDTFVTSDVRYNQFWDAKDLGLNLIDAGHFETENPICETLAELLRAKFPEVTVVLSEKHGDPVHFL